MSVTERLQAMDQLWDSLTRDGDEIPSLDWHQEVLADRKARAQRGEAKFLTLAQYHFLIRLSEFASQLRHKLAEVYPDPWGQGVLLDFGGPLPRIS